MFEDDGRRVTSGGERTPLSVCGMLMFVQALRRSAGQLELGDAESRAELVDCLTLAEVNLLRILAHEDIAVE
jgi:hypothetical protein